MTLPKLTLQERLCFERRRNLRLRGMDDELAPCCADANQALGAVAANFNIRTDLAVEIDRETANMAKLKDKLAKALKAARALNKTLKGQ